MKLSDYGEDEDQLEEVQGEEAGEITTNEVFQRIIKYCIKIIYLVVELDQEELDEGITTGMRVNPEWDSSHA